MDEADDQSEEDEDWDDAETGEAGTVVTMAEGYDIWWPPNHGEQRKRPA